MGSEQQRILNSPPWWRQHALPAPRIIAGFAAASALVAAVAHGAVVRNELLMDDESLLVSNPVFARADYWRLIPFRDYGLEFGDHLATGYFRPAFTLLAWLERQLFGVAPLPYKLVGLSLLVGACVAIAAFTWRFTRSVVVVGIATLWFASTPLKTEAVAFTTSMPDLVLSFSPALVLWPLLVSGQRRRSLPLLAASAFGATLLTCSIKDSGVFSCVPIAASALAFGPRSRRRALAVASAILVAVGCSLIARSFAELGGPYAGRTLEALLMPFSARGAGAAVWSLGMALWLALVPQPTQYFHYLGRDDGSREIATGLTPAVALMWLGGIALCVVGYRLVVTRRPFLAGVFAWGVGASYAMVLPVSAGLAFCDRYVAVGPAAILLAWGANTSFRRVVALRPHRERAAQLFACWVVLAALMANVGTAKARDRMTFWSAALEHAPTYYANEAAMAELLFEERRFADGAAFARRAIEKNPQASLTRALGIGLGMKAIIEHDPRRALYWYGWTLETQPQESRAWQGKAIALSELRQFPEARRAALEARRFSTGDELDVAKIMARIWLESPDIAASEAATMAQRANALGAALPAELTTAQGVSEARAHGGAH